MTAVADALGLSAGATPDDVQAALRRLPKAKLTALDVALGNPPESFRDFMRRTTPAYIFARHLDPLLDALQDVADGKLHRLIVEMPVRHGKSMTLSQLFPAYMLARYPWLTVGLASYGDTLSLDHARKAKQAYERAGLTLAGDAASVRHWYTPEGGSMWATSMSGGGTGKGIDVGIIDDPFKNKQDARSAAVKRSVYEFYDTVFATRQNTSDAALIVTQARWANDDLIGTLLAREADDDETPEGWRVIHLPAIAQATPPAYPATVHVVPDYREAGAALWPERWPLERLQRWKKKKPEDFSALFQQRPSAKEGSFFKWGWFPIVDTPFASAYRVRYWDTAGTDGAGDYTVGVLVAYRPGAPIEYQIQDVVRGQWAPAQRDYHIEQTCRQDAARYGVGGVTFWFEREAGVGGADRTKAIVRRLAGLSVHTEPATGEKTDRAEPLAGQAENGNVCLLRGAWNEAFLDEATAFPDGANDDQVDGASGAFNRVTDRAGQTWTEDHFAVV